MSEITVKIKNPILQFFCKHDYQHFETPIDRKTNPYGFVALNDNGVWICVKCGRKLG